MLIVLDTAVIMRDPLCRGHAWRTLAHASPAWRLKLLVPEVVIEEAVGGYQRSIEDLRQKVSGMTNRLSPLGLNHVRDAALEEFQQQSDQYRERLLKKLASLGAEILPPPDVTHMEVVRRAVARQKPCNNKGDGYRDTLNWFSLLDLLDRTNDRVAWVSDNVHDFASEEPGAEPNSKPDLHPDLVAELEAAGHGGRLRYARDLGELVMEIASEVAPELTQDMSNLSQILSQQSLVDFIMIELIDKALPIDILPESAALPTYVESAVITNIMSVKDFQFEIAGSAGDESAIAKFSATGDSVVDVTVPQKTWELLTGGDEEFGPASSVTTKQLRYSGFMTLDSIGKPQDGEITTAVALDDDPGRTEWSRVRTREALLRRLHRDTGRTDGMPLKALVPDYTNSLMDSTRTQSAAFNESLVESVRQSIGSLAPDLQTKFSDALFANFGKNLSDTWFTPEIRSQLLSLPPRSQRAVLNAILDAQRVASDKSIAQPGGRANRADAPREGEVEADETGADRPHGDG